MNIEHIKSKLLPVESVDNLDHLNANDELSLHQYFKAIGKDINIEFQPAGVLIPLVRQPVSSSWNIILTKRAQHLKHHPGEISFPGGRFENIDSDLMKTATRETHEEIGILPENIEILGKLPMQKTISGYLVTPFVGEVKENPILKIDKNEVDTAFEVPLKFALNPKNHKKVQRQVAGLTFSFYEIHYNEYRIWGATARMIVNLSRLLSVRD